MPWRYILCTNQRIGNGELGGLAQLRRGVLGLRVVDERTRAELDAREVLQPVTAAVGRIELEVQVGLRPRPAVGRGLVYRHHVRRRKSEMRVVRAGGAQQGARE